MKVGDETHVRLGSPDEMDRKVVFHPGGEGDSEGCQNMLLRRRKKRTSDEADGLDRRVCRRVVPNGECDRVNLTESG